MGDGAFALEETFPYEEARNIVGQMTGSSCVAAACRMLLNDIGHEYIPEAYIRDATNVVQGEGTALSNASKALNLYDISADYKPQLSIDELQAATNNGAAIVSITTETTGGSHALLVDGFEGNQVLIRDPLPEGQGSAYKVDIDTFTRAWTGKAVILNP